MDDSAAAPYAAPEEYAEAIVLRDAAVRLVSLAFAGADDPVELCHTSDRLCERSERLLDIVMVARRRSTFRVVPT